MDAGSLRRDPGPDTLSGLARPCPALLPGIYFKTKVSFILTVYSAISLLFTVTL